MYVFTYLATGKANFFNYQFFSELDLILITSFNFAICSACKWISSKLKFKEVCTYVCMYKSIYSKF